MKIEGFEITYLSSYDGLPVKNHLPAELKDRFKTENQWLESGYNLVVGAVGREMYPNAINKKLCVYYLDSQVLHYSEFDKDSRICATCRIREDRYCPVAGEYVSMKHSCSEWDK